MLFASRDGNFEFDRYAIRMPTFGLSGRGSLQQSLILRAPTMRRTLEPLAKLVNPGQTGCRNRSNELRRGIASSGGYVNRRRRQETSHIAGRNADEAKDARYESLRLLAKLIEKSVEDLPRRKNSLEALDVLEV